MCRAAAAAKLEQSRAGRIAATTARMGASSSRGFSPPSRRANAVPSRPSPRERAARKVAEQAEVKKLAAKVKEAAILDMMVGG